MTERPKMTARVIRGRGVPVEPRCDACQKVVDLSDPDHHVCYPDASGRLPGRGVSAEAEAPVSEK